MACEERVLRVVLPIDTDADVELVEAAARVAREHGARLELLTSIPKPWFSVWYAPNAVNLQRDLEDYSCKLVRDALRRAPADVCVDVRQAHGTAYRAALRDARDGDLVFTREGARRARRVCERAGLRVVTA
jgi:hypothetical protein